jgi:hypothetical protein
LSRYTKLSEEDLRANKKIADAEIAKGGKNDKKYLKLIGEAEAMLRQDWSQIFPDTQIPKIGV